MADEKTTVADTAVVTDEDVAAPSGAAVDDKLAAELVERARSRRDEVPTRPTSRHGLAR